MGLVKVTAVLGSPIAGDPALPLDALLSYLASVQEYGLADVFEPGKIIPYERDIVPLEVIEGDDYWFYAASNAQWPEHSIEGTDYWNKRFDDQHYRWLDADKVSVGKGRYKMYHSRIFYRHATSVYWLAYTNDLGRLKTLLSSCHALGKKRAYGWGHVLAWQFRELVSNSALDAVWKDSRPLRAVPSRFVSDFDLSWHIDTNMATIGYRPPYWATENQGMCMVP